MSVKAASDASAGDYPIAVDATSGTHTAHQDLAVTITGSYTLTLSTPDQRLNMNATAGSNSDVTLVVANTGTADVKAAAMSATAPNGWTTKFDPATVDVPAGQQVQVVAHVVPSADAIAGDYVTTFKATAPEANASADIRVTIETSRTVGRDRDRADRARPDHPVAHVPALRTAMSGVETPRTAVHPAPAPALEPREPVIWTSGLTKRYGTLTAVDDLDLDVYPGEIFGLLGQNGAGKTTTILMLLGLSEPTDGVAEVMGLDPAREPREVKRRVGYLPDAVGFYGGMTGRENLRYTARLNGLRAGTPTPRSMRCSSRSV